MLLEEVQCPLSEVQCLLKSWVHSATCVQILKLARLWPFRSLGQLDSSAWEDAELQRSCLKILVTFTDCCQARWPCPVRTSAWTESANSSLLHSRQCDALYMQATCITLTADPTLVRAVFCAKSVADQLAPGIFEADLDEACVPVIPEPLASSRCAAQPVLLRGS